MHILTWKSELISLWAVTREEEKGPKHDEGLINKVSKGHVFLSFCPRGTGIKLNCVFIKKLCRFLLDNVSTTGEHL